MLMLTKQFGNGSICIAGASPVIVKAQSMRALSIMSVVLLHFNGHRQLATSRHDLYIQT